MLQDAVFVVVLPPIETISLDLTNLSVVPATLASNEYKR
jgi:hypothetical protein